MRLRQSIVGDAQSNKGCQNDTRGNAGGDSKDDDEPDARTEPVRHKNTGALLGKENRFVESLLMGVSIGDLDLVCGCGWVWVGVCAVMLNGVCCTRAGCTNIVYFGRQP